MSSSARQSVSFIRRPALSVSPVQVSSGSSHVVPAPVRRRTARSLSLVSDGVSRSPVVDRLLGLTGLVLIAANAWVAAAAAKGLLAGGLPLARQLATGLLLACTLPGFRNGADLVLGQRPTMDTHLSTLLGCTGPLVLALGMHDPLPFQLACITFFAYLLVNVLVARRRVALVLALVGGPAVLMNLAAITVISCVALLADSPAIPRWLALLAVVRSCAGSVWGGRIMLRRIGDPSWHRLFAVWLVCDLAIAACRPSLPAFLLSLSGLLLHVFVTHLHKADRA